jgi:hypothetical protein
MKKLTVASINAPKKRKNGPITKGNNEFEKGVIGNGTGLVGGTELARDWRDQRKPQTT